MTFWISATRLQVVLRVATVILNLCATPLSLLAGMIYFGADIGVNEAFHGFLIHFGVASSFALIAVGLVVSPRHAATTVLAYGGLAYLPIYCSLRALEEFQRGVGFFEIGLAMVALDAVVLLGYRPLSQSTIFRS